MKYYRLLKDLPTFKAGEVFELGEGGSLFRVDHTGRGEGRVMAYHKQTLDKFPNILEEWFEEIKPAEPLIKDEKVRKAVRAWAEACDAERAYLRLENEKGSTFCVYTFQFNCNFIQIATHDQDPIEGGRTYAIAELCGEEEG